MRRRDFIKVVAGSVIAWPMAARAQQTDRIPLIGVAMPLPANDAEGQARVAAFLQGLQELGWIVGRNVRIEYRWGANDPERNRRNSSELVGLAPDVIFATGSPTLEPLLRATRTVPIVFVQVVDPVGAGYVDSLARPGGNATGSTVTDYDAAGKWLELLKEIAPSVKRALILRDPNTTAGIGQWAASEAFAHSLELDLRAVNVSIVREIERAVDILARDVDGGMIVTPSAPSIVYRDFIIGLAARYRLPAVYPHS